MGIYFRVTKEQCQIWRRDYKDNIVKESKKVGTGEQTNLFHGNMGTGERAANMAAMGGHNITDRRTAVGRTEGRRRSKYPNALFSKLDGNEHISIKRFLDIFYCTKIFR